MSSYPYTSHKHSDAGKCPKTVIEKEEKRHREKTKREEERKYI